MRVTNTAFWAYVILANMYAIAGKYHVGLLFIGFAVLCFAIEVFIEIKEKKNG